MQFTDDQFDQLEMFLRKSCSTATIEKFSQDFSKLVIGGALETFLVKDLGMEEAKVPVDKLSSITATRFDGMDAPAIEDVVKKVVAAF